MQYKFDNLKPSYFYTHSGIKLGLEHKYLGEKLQLIQSLNGGVFKNNSLIKSFFIQTQLTSRYFLKNGVFCDFSIGGGYLYRQFTGRIFNFNSDELQKIKPGKPSYMLISGLSMGYYFHNTETPMKVFLRYEYAISKDFRDPVSFIPDHFLMIGTVVNLFHL